MSKKKNNRKNRASKPQENNQQDNAAKPKKSNEIKWLVGSLAVLLPICAIAINWASNLNSSGKNSVSIQSISVPETSKASSAPEPSKASVAVPDIKPKYEVTNAQPHNDNAPLSEAEYRQIYEYVERSLPEAKELKNTDDLIKALSIIERLPYDKLKGWFDSLADAIRKTPYKGKYYDQHHDMDKLAAISQFLKTKVMNYDTKGVTTGQLISEIIETGFGACASMPTMYAIVCQHMGLDVTIATVGDHIYARYQNIDTWVNIEMTVRGKTGVGVPDKVYMYDFMNEDQLFKTALENGWDMTPLDKKQIMGIMYSNKASHLFMKGGFRDGNLDGLYDAACLGIYFHPNDWMLAKNWRTIRPQLSYRDDREDLDKLNQEIAKLEGKDKDPFSIGSIKMPKAKDPLAWEDKHGLSIAQNFEGKKKNLEKRIKAIQFGTHTIEETKTMTELMDELRALNPGTYGFEKKDDKLQKLKQEQFYLQEKVNRQNRKSEALKAMYELGNVIRRKTTK